MALVAIAALLPLSSSGFAPDAGTDPVPLGTDCAPDPVRQRLDQFGIVDFTEEREGGTWQTWFIAPDQITVPPPPASGSPDDLLELAEVQAAALGRDADATITSEIYGQVPASAFWQDLYMRLLEHHASKDGAKNPPTLARQMAILSMATYDALVAVQHYKYCFLRPAPAMLDPLIEVAGAMPPAPSYPSEHAAVAAVWLTMLPTIFPCPDVSDPVHCEEHPTYWVNHTGNATESRIWGGANYRSDVEAGWSIGEQALAAALAARSDDDSDLVWDGTGWPTGPCNWIRNPVGHGGRGPLLPRWGEVTPFIMTVGSQFRAPPPPACDGQDYLAQYRDLFEASLTLTERQIDVSSYWEMGQGTVTPPGQNMEIAMDKVLEYELNTLRAARVMAYAGAAVADAGIAAWDTKYAYWYDRPLQAIRRLNWDDEAGLCDNGAAVESDGMLPLYEPGDGSQDPNYVHGGCWHSLATTPPFPGYVSGHSSFTGAAQETLKYFFPDDDREFNAYQTEAAMARYYGGIHFRADNDQGIEIGRQIGHLLWERAANDGADE